MRTTTAPNPSNGTTETLAPIGTIRGSLSGATVNWGNMLSELATTGTTVVRASGQALTNSLTSIAHGTGIVSDFLADTRIGLGKEAEVSASEKADELYDRLALRTFERRRKLNALKLASPDDYAEYLEIFEGYKAIGTAYDHRVKL